MARDFDSGSTETLTFADPNCGIAGAQTCACWIKPASVSDNTILSYGDATGGRGFSYGINSSNKLRVRIYVDGGGVDQSDSSSTISTGSWIHVAFTRNQESFSTMAHYINGAADGTTGNDDPAGVQNSTDDFILGYKSPGDASGFGYFDGAIAEVCFWHEALTEREIAALRYVRPWTVRPSALKFYAPVWGIASEPEMIVGLSGTLSGTTYANHPPVCLSTRLAATPFELGAVGPSKFIPEQLGFNPMARMF